MAITKTRRPITDTNWRCIMTWRKVETSLSERTKKHFENSKKAFANKEVIDWKIHVEWLWWVKAP